MYQLNRLYAMGASVLTIGVLASVAAVPAGAATQPASRALTTQTPGTVLCNGDLCLQTISHNTGNHTAKINAWADTRTLNPGYFELITPPNSSGVREILFSPAQRWPAGGTHYTFTAVLEHGTYDMTAYAGRIPGNLVGEKGFTINF